MNSFKKWFRELFWVRCFYCKQKRKYFYYIWEVPKYSHLNPKSEIECEVCTECAFK